MEKFNGNVLFLNRDDINTDEIIPAKYLTENDKDALKPHLLEDLKLSGFQAQDSLSDKHVIVSRANFGCGSSREHAPWALEVNGIHLVIAESFARIFRQNMFACGLMAIELSPTTLDHLFKQYATQNTTVKTDLSQNCFEFSTGGLSERVEFKLEDFDRQLVEAGGWIEYADKKYR